MSFPGKFSRWHGDAAVPMVSSVVLLSFWLSAMQKLIGRMNAAADVPAGLEIFVYGSVILPLLGFPLFIVMRLFLPMSNEDSHFVRVGDGIVGGAIWSLWVMGIYFFASLSFFLIVSLYEWLF